MITTLTSLQLQTLKDLERDLYISTDDSYLFKNRGVGVQTMKKLESLGLVEPVEGENGVYMLSSLGIIAMIDSKLAN